jgi:hypothetical protein
MKMLAIPGCWRADLMTAITCKRISFAQLNPVSQIDVNLPALLSSSKYHLP